MSDKNKVKATKPGFYDNGYRKAEQLAPPNG